MHIFIPIGKTYKHSHSHLQSRFFAETLPKLFLSCIFLQCFCILMQCIFIQRENAFDKSSNLLKINNLHKNLSFIDMHILQSHTNDRRTNETTSHKPLKIKYLQGCEGIPARAQGQAGWHSAKFFLLFFGSSTLDQPDLKNIFGFLMLSR